MQRGASARSGARPGLSQRSTVNSQNNQNVTHSKWKGKAILVLNRGRSMSAGLQTLLHDQARQQGAHIATKPSNAEILIVDESVTEESLQNILGSSIPFDRIVKLSWLRSILKSNQWIDIKDSLWRPLEQSKTPGVVELIENVPPDIARWIPCSFPRGYRAQATALLQLCLGMESNKRFKFCE